jgi:hypothetical protein
LRSRFDKLSTNGFIPVTLSLSKGRKWQNSRQLQRLPSVSTVGSGPRVSIKAGRWQQRRALAAKWK